MSKVVHDFVLNGQDSCIMILEDTCNPLVENRFILNTYGHCLLGHLDWLRLFEVRQIFIEIDSFFLDFIGTLNHYAMPMMTCCVNLNTMLFVVSLKNAITLLKIVNESCEMIKPLMHYLTHFQI